MTQPVLKNRIINFSGFACQTQQQLNCHRQAYNSLMIKMSQLDKYQQVQQFTHCQKCNMILTNQDRDYIDDWNWVSSNEEFYKEKGKDMQDKIQIMRQNKYNYYIWNCRFCATSNLIQKDKAYFAKNKSKVVIKDAIQGQRNAKVFESPLLLFLIDNSSSMDEEIDLNGQTNIKQNKQLNGFVNDVLKKTEIYKKISQNQKKYLNQIKKKVQDCKNQTYVESLSKYRVLMSMTEKVTSEINETKSKSQNKFKITNQKPQAQRKIGFMFFNSDIILQKIPRKNQNTVIRVSNKQFQNDYGRQAHLKVDFKKFDDLYQLGKNNSQNYGMQISLFKFSDIQLNSIIPSGQTALGPALVIASGIVSGYGSGSLIVIVTDGKANKGIFNSQDLYQKQIGLLRLKLNNSKSEICLIQLQTKSQKKPQFQTTLQRYFRKYSSIININLTQKQPLKQLQKRLSQIIQKIVKTKTWTNNISIKCQNPNIKFNQKQLDRMKKRLFKQQQIQFISPQIKQTKFTAFDYRHPFMTQVLIQYQNIQTKQQCRFMAYIIQKIIKYTDMNKKDEQSFNSMQTLQNVLSFLEVQGEKLDIKNIPLSLSQQSFRSTIMQSYKYSLQKQYQKQIMKDARFSTYVTQNQRQNFKNSKQYIRSLTQKNYEEDDFLQRL